MSFWLDAEQMLEPDGRFPAYVSGRTRGELTLFLHDLNCE
jgi:hypothetical protein